MPGQAEREVNEARSTLGGILTTRPRGSRRSRLTLNVVTLAVTVLFSYIALKGIDLSKAWHALSASNFLWLLPALLALALAMLCRAARWRSLFAPERRPQLGIVANAMMVGYLYNNILPARAGEVARVVTLKSRAFVPAIEIVGTVVLERLYDVLAILVIFFVAEPWLPHVSWFGSAAVAAIVLVVLIVGMVLVLAIYKDRAVRILLRPFRRAQRFSGKRLERSVTQTINGLSALRHSGVAVTAFLWTVLAWMFTALCAYLVSLAIHLHVPFASAVLVTVAIGLAMILPSPPAAVGVFEGAALIGLKAYSVSRSAALPYALVLHLVNFAPFIVVGVLLVQHNLRHPRSKAPRARTSAATAPLMSDSLVSD
jgi:glycosyltransferase 2 family protein